MERNDFATIDRGTHVHRKDKPRRPPLVCEDFRLDWPTFVCLRLRLYQFDFAVKYRPALVHQAPVSLSRILTPEGNYYKPTDEEVPTYGDHEAVFVTTRRNAENSLPNPPATTARERTARKRTARTPTHARRMTTEDTTDLTDEVRLLTDFQQNYSDYDTTNDDEAIDDVLDEDLDIFDMVLAYQEDGRDPPIADVQGRLTKHELLEAQSTENLCRTVHYRRSRNLDKRFF